MAEEARTLQKREAQAREGAEWTRARKVFMPRADIYETPTSIVVVADMPGVDDKTVDITLENNVLEIFGRVEPQIPKNHSLALEEYDIGDYQRAFTLSDEVDRNNIQAVVKNGVLTLTLPKAPQAQARKIKVQGQ